MEEKFKVLEGLYALLEKETGQFSTACRDRCPACCTCNVTMTGLEGAYIRDRLSQAQWAALVLRLEQGFSERRFRPEVTLNGFARACMEGTDIPEEENDPGWGPCPLLQDLRCTIYAVRPLGCRVMMSETACEDKGFARMPPFALTLSNLVGQYLEQLDQGGISGNLSDILSLCKEAEPDFFLDNLSDSDRKGIFLRNQPVPVLMVPPEHRADAAPLIGKIRAIAGL